MSLGRTVSYRRRKANKLTAFILSQRFVQQLVAQIKWTKIHQDFTDLVFESLISYQTEPYFNSDSAMFSAVGVLKCSIYTI